MEGGQHNFSASTGKRLPLSPRTHWDMLRERRSIEELDELLTERIENLRSRRRAAARLLKEQKAQEEGEA